MADDDKLRFLDDDIIVIDNGSGVIKAGLGGEDAPKSEFKSLIGFPNGKPDGGGMPHSDYYVGGGLQERLGILDLVNPIEHGRVTNWDAMEKIWNYTFFESLRVDPEDKAVVLTEAAENPVANTEKMAEIMFESFNAGALRIAIQGVCALYSTGDTTGLVLDIGDGICHSIPVFDGHEFINGIGRLELAGRDLTSYLARTLLELGHTMDSPTDRQEVDRIKIEQCYVAEDFEAEMAKDPAEYTKTVQAAGGVSIELGNQRFRVPEELFNPVHIGTGEMQSVPAMMVSRVQEGVPAANRAALYKNIFLSGGTTMFPGFSERLQKEVQALVPEGLEVNVIARLERKYAVWLGASIMTGFSDFTETLVTLDEYAENGCYNREDA